MEQYVNLYRILQYTHCLLHEYMNVTCFIFSCFRTKGIHRNLDLLFFGELRLAPSVSAFTCISMGGEKANPSLSFDKGLKKSEQEWKEMNTKAHAVAEMTRSPSTWDNTPLQLTATSDLVSVASTPNLLTDSDLLSV